MGSKSKGIFTVPKQEKVCAECAQTFFGFHQVKYCSELCRSRAKNRRNPPQNYPNHKETKRKAQRKYERAHGERKIDLRIPYTDEQLAAKYALWGNRCWICGCTDKPLTRDHVKPVSKGGADMLSNIRPACQSCNSKKHNQWPVRYTKALTAAYLRSGL
jgi:5-methylcytosine-specific restriction endonuclease McrA